METTSVEQYEYEVRGMVQTLSEAVSTLEALLGEKPLSYPSRRQMKALISRVERVGPAVTRLAKRTRSYRLSGEKTTPEMRVARRLARAEAILREAGYAVVRPQ